MFPQNFIQKDFYECTTPSVLKSSSVGLQQKIWLLSIHSISVHGTASQKSSPTTLYSDSLKKMSLIPATKNLWPFGCST